LFCCFHINKCRFEDEGATATALLTWLSADGNTRLIQCANVGDSSAFLVRAGKAVALTVDHKVTTPSERSRVEALGIELGEKATRIPGGKIEKRVVCLFDVLEQDWRFRVLSGIIS
jgi:protein phosphatase